VIKEYFANYFLHMSAVTLDMRENRMEVRQRRVEPWRVSSVHTGDGSVTEGGHFFVCWRMSLSSTSSRRLILELTAWPRITASYSGAGSRAEAASDRERGLRITSGTFQLYPVRIAGPGRVVTLVVLAYLLPFCGLPSSPYF